jgi:hypothetical protein
MNECPTCGRKIRGDICPYCDEAVSEEENGDSSPVSGQSLLAVYGSDLKSQAEFVMSLLESEGIPAYQESGDSIDHSQDPLGQIEGDVVVLVDEEDADRAREVIDSHKHELDSGDA